MARLEIEIGGTDKGGNAELKETIGLLEQLMAMRKGLSLDLIQAEDVQQIRAVGENLTSVNLRIGEYLNLATKATQAWRDDRTEVILDNLATKLSVVQANVQVFGSSLQAQRSELSAYQSAFDQLITNGLDRTNTEVMALESQIKTLTKAMSDQKTALGEQKVYDSLTTKLRQIAVDTRLLGDANKGIQAQIKAFQTAIDGLIKSGVSPADAKIIQLRTSIESLNATLKKNSTEAFNKSLQKTGSLILDAENKVNRLRQNATFAKSEKDVERYNKRLSAAVEELKRLQTAGTNAGNAIARVGSQTSQAGVEFARIIQDAPYAAQNFGSIGNNITRVAELWPQYIAGARAAVVANGQVATSTNVLKTALVGMVAGANGWILAISALVTAYTVWQMESQRRARNAEKEKKVEEEYTEVIEKRVKALDAVSRATNQGREDALSEISRINTLRAAIENELVPRANRLAAVKALKAEFPKHFKNLSDENILAGKVANTYSNLADQLMKTALAQAALGEAVEIGRSLIKLETVRFDNLTKINEASEKAMKAEAEINKLIKKGVTLREDAIRVGLNDSPDIRFNKEQLALIAYQKQLTEARTEITALNSENAKASNEATKKQKEIGSLQKYTNDLVVAGADITEDFAKTDKAAKEKQIKVTKELGQAIQDIYKPQTDKGNLVGLEGLYKTNQATQNRYQELLDKTKKAEADFTSYYTTQVTKKVISAEEGQKRIAEVQAQSAEERKQIETGLNEELIKNTKLYVDNRDRVISEAEAKAGIVKKASRERDLQIDKLYWDKQAKTLKEAGVTEEQILEFRKAAEAQINAKWDAKIAEETFNLQRRLNENVSQLMLQRLNKDTKLQIEAAKGNAEKLLQIEKNYQAQVAAIQSRDRNMKAELAFDGTALSVPIAKINQEIELLKQNFQTGLNPSVEQFRSAVSSLEVQRQELQLWQGTIDSISSSFGSFAGDVLFDTENAIKNLGKAFENVAKSIISELVKIGIRYAINQALGTASMAASTAASTAAAGAVASAWATPAALVSAATFGASAAAGAAALGAFIASTKALALTGFSSGGYTGGIGRKEVAGVVHGQEFVINAKATRDNMPLLRAINSGADVSSALGNSGRNVNFGSLQSGGSQVITVNVVGTLDNGVIKLSNDEGTRAYKRYFGN